MPPSADPASLQPYASSTYNAAAYDSMRELRKPIVTTHLYTFYVISAVIILHISAVVITELREGGNIVSAMLTGRKTISGRPQDLSADTPESE